MKLWSLSLAFVAVAGCGGSMPLSRYLSVTHASGFDDLTPGHRVAVNAATGECATTKTADDLPTLLNDEGSPLGGQAWAAGHIFTIRETQVSQDTERVAIEVVGDEGGDSHHWIALPASGASCVYPVEGEKLATSTAQVGKQLVFAPWKPTCSVVEAAGSSARSLLFESDPGSAMPVTGVTVAPASATQNGSPVAWIVFAKGAVRVRSDVVDSCFATPGTDDAEPPSGVRDLLRVTKASCPSDTVNGKPHVACRSSVGVWEGAVTDKALSLRLVRRTLGPAHFVGGAPVARDAFARAIVAVRLSDAPTPREESLASALRRAVVAGLAGEGGLVRATTAGDPNATMELFVGASQLVIGELQRTETSDTVKYKDHQETHANPKKAQLRKAATDAETQINNAQNEIVQAEARLKEAQRAREQEKVLKEQAIEACRENANRITNSIARNLALAGCTGADIAVNPDGGVPEAQKAISDGRNHLAEAQGRKATAEAELAATPDTVTEWVTMPWTYKKHVVTRTVSVRLETRVTPRGGTPRESSEPVQISLTDYEVAEDARHEVPGHSANPDIVSTPDNMIPQIAVKLAERLSGALHQILTEEQQAAALRLFAEAGGEPAREEYRHVDAAAFEAVGRRLKKATRRGTGTATTDGLSLPTSLVDLGAHGCMLAVAVADEPPDGALKLTTPTGSHGDLRGVSSTLVEICADDGPVPDTVSVTAKNPTKVRWGLYLLAGEGR